ncbi:MAG: DUF1540 domain-containing protein [Lawsonibacter sp.]|nr:DUF1540 domain-containing protein [Lawsonibacter sp.]
MDYRACNTNIKCSVDSCAYHNAPQNCCSLEAIKVGCCDCNPTRCEGTECASFKLAK